MHYCNFKGKIGGCDIVFLSSWESCALHFQLPKCLSPDYFSVYFLIGEEEELLLYFAEKIYSSLLLLSSVLHWLQRYTVKKCSDFPFCLY